MNLVMDDEDKENDPPTLSATPCPPLSTILAKNREEIAQDRIRSKKFVVEKEVYEIPEQFKEWILADLEENGRLPGFEFDQKTCTGVYLVG